MIDPKDERHILMRYFILVAISAAVAASLANAQSIDFSKDVWPIFAERCIECHGPDKHKGDLRFDDKEWLGDVEIVAPGKPEDSLIYKNINLPLDDDNHMPNEGDPLTREQIVLIRLWIAEGAKAGDWNPEDIVFAKAPESSKPKSGIDLAKLAEGVAPAPEEALRAIRDIGGLALPLAQDNNLVRVDMKLARDAAGDAQLALLDPIAGQVTWLGLANTAVTDAGLAALTKLPKLTALHLENTKVGDAGLASLAGLSNLEYLNLYGTQVGDAGVQQLAVLKNLKKLYLWQTKATKDGAAKLREALPELEVNLGEELQAAAAAAAPAADAAPVAITPAANPLALFFDDGGCCAKAAASGASCDHDCCKLAAQENKVCTKCNTNAAKKQEVAKLFATDSCCAQALAKGELCAHDCCKEAWAKLEVCTKCNAAPAPVAAPAAATDAAKLAVLFDDESCCATAHAKNEECAHPCCAEARAKGEVCTKCNPGAVAKLLAQ
ncbi:MAG: c-type cytochrome domain-containing protein [Candidatus Hydrogenedentota bacterium]